MARASFRRFRKAFSIRSSRRSGANNIQPQINADERRFETQKAICVYLRSSAAITEFFGCSEESDARSECGARQHRSTQRPLWSSRSGQAVSEFALLYAGVILPLTFMLVFVAEMLWIWHSVVDFTRYGARYASTHCWEADGSASNVITYMESNVPPMIDMNQFQTGAAGIQVSYFSQNPDGTSTPFESSSCGGTICVPDTVSVSITNYQFTRFSGFLGLPSVTMPSFTTNVPMESAGYSDASGTCAP